MQLLKEIKDREWPQDETGLKFRESSRAVLFDENNLVPILFVSKYNFHKLPGGGIEEGENRHQALNREIMEEVGSKIEVTGEVGKIIEFRSKWGIKQTSYCYTGKIISKGSPSFTQKELDHGFKILWLSLEEAIAKIENDNSENYEDFFIQKRELEFLKKAKEIIS